MSINQHYRRAWCIAIFAQAVTLFHTARKEDQNRDVPLADLARQCANTVFSENSNTIVGDKEPTAKEFMAHCREHFAAEINAAIAARARKALANRPEEARVM